MTKIVEVSEDKKEKVIKDTVVEAREKAVVSKEKIEGKEVGKKKFTIFGKEITSFKPFIFPIVAIFTLMGIAIFYYFVIYRLKPTPPSEVVLITENYIRPKSPLSHFTQSLPLLSQPNEPKTEVSPLNGLLFTKKEMDLLKGRRPVAVMINNHSEARPQSGLNSADIVIEAHAEGGITRYLGIFWSSAPAKVGPIRSLRQYYLEWLSEYDPILIHDGCAESTNPKTNACGNLHAYGIKDIGTTGAWRYNDGRRVAPHNEYSSITNAWEYSKKVNWNSFPSNLQSLEFKKDADITERGKQTVVKTVFHMRLNNSGQYDAIWSYDPQTNSYYRKIGGSIDIDQETNTQLNAKNVVIQQVKMVPSGDGTARVIIDTIGEGDAVILQDGKIINGRWKKTSRLDRTKYYDSSGKPIKFNRGRIWIVALPQANGKFDIIEQ